MNYLETLDETIRKLEMQRDNERMLLKEQFQIAYESIKPANLVRSAIKEVTQSKELRENLLNYAVGMGTGYITKKVVVGKSHNPLRSLLGNVLQFGVSNVISKKSDLIKSAGTGLLKMILGKRKNRKSNPEDLDQERFNEALYMDA
jgi:hypothetical protein